MPLVDVVQRSPEWREARMGMITASVAAACLGLDEHRGPLSAYNEIMGLSGQSKSRAAAWGIHNEMRAISSYEVRTGTLVESTGFWVHPSIPWLGASPDALVGTDGLLEVKCPINPLSRPTEAQLIQVRVQLICTGRLWCDWLCWREDEEHLERIQSDQAADLLLLGRLREWYDKYIATTTPPPRRRVKV